jgi:DNA repair protein RadC
VTKKQAIKNLALRYQPREKLRQRGIQALSNRELLAIIISSA